MAITVPFGLAYELEVKALAPDVFAVLSDVPTSDSHCPKVAQLVTSENEKMVGKYIDKHDRSLRR